MDQICGRFGTDYDEETFFSTEVYGSELGPVKGPPHQIQRGLYYKVETSS